MKDNSRNWPPIEGRYKVGDKNSSVAVCTNASIDEIKVDLHKIAIIGKCVTENIGIEKIIQNVVSNPNIRYLILCGRDSKGHFVSQAIESLVRNGIDKEKRIIGAKGNMPYLRNINKELIERFRKQITPVDITGETSNSNIENIIDKLLETKPEEFQEESIKITKAKEIEARPAKWAPDPNGHFLISINHTRKKIVVEHYKKGKINKKIIGENAKEICDTIAKSKLIGDFEQTLEHGMYLGRELKKAEIALNNRLNFEQDSELRIKNKVGKQKKKSMDDEFGWHD